jgi:hypothetical protein
VTNDDAAPAATAAVQPPDAELRSARKLTMKWIAIGWGTFAVVFPIAWLVVPRPAPIAAPLDRLLLAVQLSAGPAVVLMLILQGLWRAIDTLEAENPLLGKESYGWKINQRVMNNTIEQLLIFVPMFLALAIRIDPDRVFVLPLLMAFWCVARLMFWVGYRRGLHLRAPGMDWTSGTSMVTAFLLGATLF